MPSAVLRVRAPPSGALRLLRVFSKENPKSSITTFSALDDVNGNEVELCRCGILRGFRAVEANASQTSRKISLRHKVTRGRTFPRLPHGGVQLLSPEHLEAVLLDRSISWSWVKCCPLKRGSVGAEISFHPGESTDSVLRCLVVLKGTSAGTDARRIKATGNIRVSVINIHNAPRKAAPNASASDA